MTKRRDFDIDHIDPRWEDGRDYQLVCGLDCPLNFREEDPSKNSSKSNRFLPWRWIADEIGVIPCNPGDLAYFLVGADIENDIPGEWILMEFLSEEWFEASKHTCAAAVYSNLLVENARKWRAENPDKVEESTKRLLEDLRKWQERNPDIREQNTQKLQEGRKKFQEKNPDFLKDISPLGTEGLKRWREENPELDEERLRKMREGQKEWIKDNPEWVEAHMAEMWKKTSQWAKDNPEEMIKRGKRLAEVVSKMKYQCTVTGHISTPGPLTIYQRKRGIDPSNRIQIN